jgi:hypothetical protein
MPVILTFVPSSLQSGQSSTSGGRLIRDFLMFSGFSPSDYVRRQNYLRQHGVHINRNHFPLPD